MDYNDSISFRKSKSLTNSPNFNTKDKNFVYNEKNESIADTNRLQITDESLNFSHMKITESNHIQNNHNNMPTKNKFYNFEEGPYMNLEYKYNKLKEKYRISKRDANSWRESYFNLLSDSLIFEA